MRLISKKQKAQLESIGTHSIEPLDQISNKEGRVRLSCDISKENHRRLKVYAANKDRSIFQVVEDLIDSHCTLG